MLSILEDICIDFSILYYISRSIAKFMNMSLLSKSVS
jgi:hypothetical protein